MGFSRRRVDMNSPSGSLAIPGSQSQRRILLDHRKFRRLLDLIRNQTLSLSFNERGVVTVLPDQFEVGAAFDDVAFFEDDDFVGSDDGG